MNVAHNADLVSTHAHPGLSSLGEILRSGREGAGLNVEDVSAQLKLSPRQVRALEEERYEQLPGKAFLRGFVRNYARLLQLDGDALVAKLEAPTMSPMFGASIAPTRGELPQERGSSKAWRAWTLPAVLLAAIAAGAYLELRKPEPPLVNLTPATRAKPVSTPVTNPAPLVPDANSPTAPASLAFTPVSLGETQNAAPVTLASAPAVASTVTASKESGLSSAPGEIELRFRERSWVQIRDRSGRLLMSHNNAAGSHQAIKGTPPLSLVIGNAPEVQLVYNGKPVDLAAHSVKNVARLTLR